MSKTKTHEEYVIELLLKNPDIEVVGTYIDVKTKILHRCKIDGYEWMAKPNNILNGRGCPRCSKKERKTYEDYIVELSKINPNIEVVEKYVNARTPILHKCKIDGYEWMTAPTNTLKGHGCPICAKNKKCEHEEYVEKVAKLNLDIEVVDTYIDALTTILHKCKLDGFEWMARPSAILYGNGCPRCNASKGEKMVAHWLEEKNILYEAQKIFEDCKNIHALPFDFYLSEYNICIEYQGKQHYEPIEYFGGQKTFENQVLRDNIKEKYCQKNNILLFKIPYYADIYDELEKMYGLMTNENMFEEVAI